MAARYALLEGGHSASCVCNLCTANCLLLSALGVLGVVEAEVSAERKERRALERQVKELQEKVEAQQRDGVAPEDEKG